MDLPFVFIANGEMEAMQSNPDYNNVHDAGKAKSGGLKITPLMIISAAVAAVAAFIVLARK